MEGGCSRVMGLSTLVSDFDSTEIPMSGSEWKGNLNNNHPICDMTYNFVKDILTMRNISCCSNLFISFDGRGKLCTRFYCDQYESHDRLSFDTSHDNTLINNFYEPYFLFIFYIGSLDEFITNKATILTKGKFMEFDKIIDAFSAKGKGYDTKYLEMFVAIHGAFFIMNPRSTFSFEVFVVRTILGLESVPILKNKDFYVKASSEVSSKVPLWVTFVSVENAVLDLYRNMTSTAVDLKGVNKI
jgi:hypothetical protein